MPSPISAPVTLQVTTPAFLMNSPQVCAFWKFACWHPNVAVTLCSSDERINLVADGFDMAIRSGTMTDSTLKSRKIGTFERCLVAAPSYQKTIDSLSGPEDLKRCDFVQLDMLPDKFVLKRGNKAVTIQAGQYRVLVNSIGGARSAVLAGLGAQRLLLSEVSADIAAGRLVQVLPEWSLPTFNICAVWPESNRRSSLIGLLLECLVGAKEGVFQMSVSNSNGARLGYSFAGTGRCVYQ